MNDIIAFSRFFKKYLTSRLFQFGVGFENFKDVIVALLIVKRGRYSSSFLNTSFLLLVIAGVVAGPAIAENNPFINNLDESQTKFETTTVAFDPFSNSLSTIISDKPRDRVEVHTVKKDETLASIAKQYVISVDTIKWANNLKSDSINVGQKLNIPPGTGIVHKVASGDNIYSIAKKYKVDPQLIVNFPFNDFADPDTFQLTTGQTVFVPEGVIEQEKPAYYAGGVGTIQAGVKGSSSFIMPTSGIITQYAAWYHMALDIANASAPPVIASDTGSVVYAGCQAYGYGCHVIVDHGNGYKTLYAHLSVISVSPNQVVSKGQQIGIMGSTGRSTGTHLHFEIILNGVQLNPLNFLQ